MLTVGSSEKLDPTLGTSPVDNFALNNQDPTFTIINHVLIVS